MYKRPQIRVKPRIEHTTVPPSNGHPMLPLRDTAIPPPPRPYIPIWKPSETLPEPPPPPPRKETPHICKLLQNCKGTRPSLKDMIEAARADGLPEEKLQNIRKSYAKMNRDRAKNDEKIDKIFGKLKKPVKKVLKVVKKRE